MNLQPTGDATVVTGARFGPQRFASRAARRPVGQHRSGRLRVSPMSARQTPDARASNERPRAEVSEKATGARHSTSPGELALFVLILALATVLRLYRLDLIDVRFDEASALQLALGIAHGHLLPVAPFSGSVANHPPVYLYLMALPYLFTRDFLTVATYRALLDVAAIALSWWLCRRFFGLRVAVIACALFALGPWAIQFARKTWLAPLPLFSVVTLFGLLEALERRNPWGWAVAGLGLALSVGAHWAAVYIAPVVIIALILGWRTVRPRPLLTGLVPLAILTAVYLGFDAGQNFANVRGLFGASSGSAHWSLDALNFALWGSGGAHLSDLTSSAFPIWQAQVAPIFNLMDVLQSLWLIGSVVVLLALLVTRFGPAIRQLTGTRPAPGWAAKVSLLVWLILPIVLQLRHARPLQIHYFVPLYPVPFIVMALGADVIAQALQGVGHAQRPAAWRRGPALALAGGIGLIGLIAGWQLFTTMRFTRFIEQYDTSNGGYGPPIRSALDVAQLARSRVRSGRVSDVVVVAPGGDPSVNEPATVFDVLLADMPHRFADSEQGLILREDEAQYIFTAGTTRAREMLAANIDAMGEMTRAIPIRNGSDAHYDYVFVPRAKLTKVREQPAAWADGVGLLGYVAPTPAALTLTVAARVFREARPGEDAHWFAHVYRGDVRVSQRDTGGVRPSNWRTGDILLLWFDLPTPPDGIRPTDVIRFGAYSYPQVQPISVVDAAGRPVADHVALALGAQ